MWCATLNTKIQKNKTDVRNVECIFSEFRQLTKGAAVSRERIQFLKSFLWQKERRRAE